MIPPPYIATDTAASYIMVAAFDGDYFIYGSLLLTGITTHWFQHSCALYRSGFLLVAQHIGSSTSAVL